MKKMDLNSTPLAVAFDDYIFNGWRVTSLPLAKKHPPLKHTTGGAPTGDLEKFPDYTDSQMPYEEMWEHMEARLWGRNWGNIAIILPDGYIGIDVDGPVGMASYTELCERLGALSLTVVLSSHENLSEGFTAYFKIPTGKKWKSSAGLKIDIIRKGHRYSAAPPSIHPSGRVYSWFNEYGQRTPYIPEIEECPELPAAWVEHLTIEAAPVVKSFRDGTPLNGVDVSVLQMEETCTATRENLSKWVLELSKGGSRHEAMLHFTMRNAELSALGHRGGMFAVGAFRKVWVEKFTEEEQKSRNLGHELLSAMRGAEAKVNTPLAKPCYCKNGKNHNGPTIDHRSGIVSGLKSNRAKGLSV